MPVRFRILGPVEIESDGRITSLSRRRERCLLGVLLLQANRPVSIDRLAELLWDDDPPKRIRGAVQGHMSRLRAALVAAGAGSDVELVFAGDGYRLVVDPEAVDAHQFRTLRERAAGIAEPAERVAQLRAALDLWRGPALADALGDAGRDRWCSDLEEQRLAVFEDMASASLLLRREREMLPELARVAGDNPGREGLVALHMRALYQAGRRADALGVYSRACTYLADELGLDPGPALRDLHRAILRDELALTAPASGSTTQVPEPMRPTSAPVPSQLPADVVGFIGRQAQLDQLDSLLPKQGEKPTSVVISAVGGTAGVGKTALAIHWAHRVIERFPDGQLYINLRGYDLEQPMTNRAALARFLTALGVSEWDIPKDLHDRATRYRSEIAGRRMLIVLDNASSVEQVRPLLPGSGSSMVMVTSRDSLAGLVAVHGARRIDLDPLPPGEAVTLLRHVIGRRVDAEPEAAAKLASQCARLPLAVRVAGERAVSRPTDSVADFVAELADRNRRLDLLDGGDPYAAVRTVFSWSIQHLSPNAAETFRMLGLHPGPDFDVYAIAAMAGVSLEYARRALDQLTRGYLIQLTDSGRWSMHDLLRSYAAELASIYDTIQIRHAAVSRLLDYYWCATAMATDVAYPYERERRSRAPLPSGPIPSFSDLTSAIGWLDTELPNLLAVARHAREGVRPEHTMRMSAVLHRHLGTRGRYRDAQDLHRRALTAAHATDDEEGELAALIGLGEVFWRQGQYEAAADHYQRAVEIARVVGDRGGELAALNGLGQIHRVRGRREEAGSCYQRAIQIARATGNHTGELYALNGVGHVRLTQGRHAQAKGSYRRAVQVARVVGDRGGELAALNGLGLVCRVAGQHEQAAEYYDQALQIARATGHRSGELDALTGIGWVHLKQGRYEQAAEQYQQLYDIASETGSRNWMFEALQGLGRMRHATGHPDAAIAHHEEALALAGDLGQPDDQARAYDGLAYGFYALHQHEQARKHWRAALDLLSALGVDHTEDEQANVAAIRAHLDESAD